MGLTHRLDRLERAAGEAGRRCAACGAPLRPARPMPIAVAWPDEPPAREPCAVCGLPRTIVLTLDDRSVE